MMQEYASKPFITGIGVLSVILFILLAKHRSLLWPGVIGIFAVTIFSNFFGILKAKAHFLEIGFKDQFFYMASAYDIAFKKEVHFYPLAFANASREGQNVLYINYQGQIVRLRAENWPALEEIWFQLNNPPPEQPENINFA
jgi:hypothetical protein